MVSASSAPPTSSLLTYTFFFIFLILNNYDVSCCYTSIFGFGDSITDTGNLLLRSPPNDTPHMGLPPYGETFFHHPTGRCSDGRLVIDFLAEYYGLPLVPPSSAVKNANRTAISTGVNFAVVGAPALDLEFYWERGISDPETNDSLRIQLKQFKELLPSLCDSSSSCKRLLKKSLILLGHFGGNDYTHSFLSGKGLHDILPFVPLITKAIASAVYELVELGAMTIVVPGMLPIGCVPAYLTAFQTTNTAEYDQSGCLIWLNKLAEYHDELLQRDLQQTREIHPDAVVIFADFYNSAMQLYRFPTKYGFTSKGFLNACCGAGGPYNFISSATRFPSSNICDNPSLNINWDGYHLTEAAYRWISKGIIEGPYAVPPLNTFISFCDPENLSVNQRQIAQA